MPQKLFVLLAAITSYPATIPVEDGDVEFSRLYGCINDAGKLKSFVEANYDGNILSILELYNEEATKQNICNAFISHLGQATADDIALFYFSGHGTQEYADQCFATETDGKLESLVCYTSGLTTEQFLLADKELRYLIHQVTQKNANLTIVIDCCHSGDVTRSAIVKTNYHTRVEKKSAGAYVFPQRSWSDFIFNTQFSVTDFIKTGISHLLPQGNHVLFSAAQSNEYAYEIGGEGVFTKTLVNVLNLTYGQVSNQSLFERVSMIMRDSYIQKPAMYTSGDASNLRSTGFLNSKGFVDKGNFIVIYNKSKGWVLNAGVIHGLYPGLKSIELTDPTDGSHIEAGIVDLGFDHTILDINVEDHNKTFTAEIGHLMKRTLNLYILFENVNPSDATVLLDALFSISDNEIKLTDSIEHANIVLHQTNGIYYLARPDDKFRPLSALATAMHPEELITQLKHISSFQFVNELQVTSQVAINPGKYISVEYALGNEPYQELFYDNGISKVIIDKWLDDDEYPTTTLQMRVRNIGRQDIFIALLYLDINFSANSFLLEPSPYLLEPGNTVNLHINGDTTLPIEFYPQAIYYNHREYSERFKLIVSESPFEIYPLKLEPLPLPPLPGSGSQFFEKGLRRGVVARQKNLSGWFTISTDIVFVNPWFNKIQAGRLKEMLDDPQTALFAEGLYFSANETGANRKNAFIAELQLKPGVQIVGQETGSKETGSKETASQEAVLTRMANLSFRQRRNNYYNDIIRRFPERLKLVAAGDSWFNHPFLQNITAHLSQIYAVRNLSADTPDTLSDYLGGTGEYDESFHNLLREIQPAFFLISGGGNDILGRKFKNFLVNEKSRPWLQNKNAVAGFFNESFIMELETLMKIFRTIFGMLTSDHPGLKIIVHGYDYPRQLDYTQPESLGSCMIEKGITKQADQQNIVRYIVDEFNARLSETASGFDGSVYYLDLRHTIRSEEDGSNQWYDEVHPGNNGFQMTALKFIRLIESLTSQASYNKYVTR